MTVSPQSTSPPREKPSECNARVVTDELVLVYRVHENGYSMRFWCFSPLTSPIGSPPLLFQTAGEDCSPVPTENVDEAQVLIEGSVKWDGCADFDVGDDREESYKIHACGRRDALELARAIELIYDTAAKVIPQWDAELAS